MITKSLSDQKGHLPARRPRRRYDPVDPHPIGTRTSRPATTEELEIDTVTSKDGTRIAFDRSGDGPLLVLIGGALSDRSAAGPLAGHLAPSFTVVVYDRRGRGDSGDTSPYQVEREIEDLDALIDHVGGSAFLFGHSSGAVLALRAADALGPTVPMLALYEPPFIVDDSRPPLPVDYLDTVEKLVAAGRRGDAVEYFMVAGVGLPPEAAAGLREDPSWPEMQSVAHTIAYDGRVMRDAMAGSPAPLQRWGSIGVPTLVMDGGASPPWQRSAVQALARVLPRCVHRSLPGQTHAADPEVLAPVLRAFFQDEPPP